MRRLSIVMGVVACLLAATASAAEDPKKLFESATAEFNLGHYEKAASMYEDVYKITLEPVLLYNIAQARRLGGDLEKAIFFYKGYLRAQPQAKNRLEVQRRIADLEVAVEAKKRSQERPPNAPVTAEGQPATAAPTTEAPPPVSPPSGAEPPTAPAPVAAAPALVETKPPPAEKPITKKPWFWAVVGVGAVVVVGVSIGLGVGLSSPSNPKPALGAVTVQ